MCRYPWPITKNQFACPQPLRIWLDFSACSTRSRALSTDCTIPSGDNRAIRHCSYLPPLFILHCFSWPKLWNFSITTRDFRQPQSTTEITETEIQSYQQYRATTEPERNLPRVFSPQQAFSTHYNHPQPFPSSSKSPTPVFNKQHAF